MANKLTIENGRQYFWQWDVGQRLVVSDSSCKEVHFYNGGEGALTQTVYLEDGEAFVNVPDILLQNARGLETFLYIMGENEAHTLLHQHIDIRPRPQPLEYAFTPTEILSWRVMDSRMKALLEEISQTDYAAVQNLLKEISDELSANWQDHEKIREEIADATSKMEGEIADTASEMQGKIDSFDGKIQGKVSIGLANESRTCSTNEQIHEAMEAFFQASVWGGLTGFALEVDSANVSYPFHMGSFHLMIFRDSDYGMCMLTDVANSLGSLVCYRDENGWDMHWESKGLTPDIGPNGNWFVGSTDTGKPSRGYTPVKGTDYWTEADKAEIKAYVDDAILGGAW